MPCGYGMDILYEVQNKLTRGYFTYKGCPKNRQSTIFFLQNNEIFGYDQNIGSTEKF